MGKSLACILLAKTRNASLRLLIIKQDLSKQNQLQVRIPIEKLPAFDPFKK